MDPKPIGRITPDRGFKLSIDVRRDRSDRSSLAVFVSGNFLTDFEAPLGQTRAETEACK